MFCPRSGLAPRLSGLASKPERRTKPLVGGIWVPENVSGFVQGPLYPGVPHKGLCTSAAPSGRVSNGPNRAEPKKRYTVRPIYRHRATTLKNPCGWLNSHAGDLGTFKNENPASRRGDFPLFSIQWEVGGFQVISKGYALKRITDPSFRYIPAARTDIRRTFKRERDRLKESAAKDAQKVSRLPVRRASK